MEAKKVYEAMGDVLKPKELEKDGKEALKEINEIKEFILKHGLYPVSFFGSNDFELQVFDEPKTNLVNRAHNEPIYVINLDSDEKSEYRWSLFLIRDFIRDGDDNNYYASNIEEMKKLIKKYGSK